MTERKVSNMTPQIDAIFNRLRARLFNMVETSVSKDPEVCSAMKKSIRDYTSQAWNDIANLHKNQQKGE